MADKHETNTQLVDLAERIQDWSIRANLSDNKVLQHIVDSIKTSRLGHLSLLPSIVSFWPKPKPQAGATLIRMSQIISIFRNALIFLPVALTWKAVSEATYGFARFTEQNKDLPVNFLTFWQAGYGYIDEFWQIGHVAELDFQIILGVILLTLLSVFLLRTGKRQQTESLEDLKAEGELLVFELSLLNVGKGTANTSSLDKIAKDALITIASSMREADGILVELKSYQREITESIEKVLDLSSTLGQVSNRQQAVLEQLMLLISKLDEISDLKAREVEIRRTIKRLLDDLGTK